MKTKSITYWLISSIVLAIAALWGAVSELSGILGAYTVAGIALGVFGLISIIAAFVYGIRNNGSGWLFMDGITSLGLGLSFIFAYIDYALFSVDHILMMGLWLMFLGISQINRYNKKSRGFGRGLAIATAVLAVAGGLSIYIKPIATLLYMTKGGGIQVYSLTFQLLLATLLVLSRLAIKDAKK